MNPVVAHLVPNLFVSLACSGGASTKGRDCPAGKGDEHTREQEIQETLRALLGGRTGERAAGLAAPCRHPVVARGRLRGGEDVSGLLDTPAAAPRGG